MSRGKPYEFLKAFKEEYGIIISNKRFDEIISLEYRKTKKPHDLFRLIQKINEKVKKTKKK